MDSCESPLLFDLAVFRSIIRKQLFRSVHVYRFEDGQEKRLEREFIFSPTSYVEMQAHPAHPFLKLSKHRVSDFTKGRMIGLWSCIFAFNADTPCPPSHFPWILKLSRNPKLKAIPMLADDIEKAFQLSSGTKNKKVQQFAPKETCEEKKDQMLDQDLNSVSPPLHMEELLENQQSDEAVPDATGKKKKRAATEHIKRIELSDLVKYFDLPIVEASRNLNVGLTVLKRKCRELGIPRWPHRKIKSLDTLIHDLKFCSKHKDMTIQTWLNMAVSCKAAS
ncbi:protein RKD5-like isoform X2 [Macadamia integrifolia]|uniref:protein RKD5-like isoform X2 n=1 Tax=Macadamia integrifolia TaxID=60698 RepID=UPI001C4E4BBB|nr:protein RKD5-like isoform X2 [Macadamia integrifolia]